jgi:hypothetical protein
VHLFACASGPTQEECLDAGDVTLRDGATRVVTGAYQAPAVAPLRLTHLPVDLRTAEVAVLARSVDEVTQLPTPFAEVSAPGTAATVSLSAVPGGNLLWVIGTRQESPRALVSRTELVAPAELETLSRFNAERLFSPFFTLDRDGLALRWSGGGDGGTIIATQAGSDFSGPAVQWNAYVDPSATSVSFPVLPDDLIDATPSQWRFANIVKLDVPGETADGLIRTIDRIWFQWPNHAKLVPAAGGRSVRAFHQF